MIYRSKSHKKTKKTYYIDVRATLYHGKVDALTKHHIEKDPYVFELFVDEDELIDIIINKYFIISGTKFSVINNSLHIKQVKN